MTTTNQAQNNDERRYGIFSLLSLIVGVVIGSGIFVKNESVVAAAGSTLYAMIAWLIMSAFIFLMIFAYVEIASSTKISKKPGTFSHWMSTFVSPKVGKLIGVYLIFIYYPFLFIGLTKWGAEKVLYNAAPNFFGQGNLEVSHAGIMNMSVIGLSLLFFIIVWAINIWSLKASKGFGTMGLIIKTIPLWTVIIIFIIASSQGVGAMPSSDVPTTPNGFGSIILALPPIMFAFDSFVFSASVQNEAKSQKTFMTAWIGGMTFVLAIYLLYSFSVMYIMKDHTFTLVGVMEEWFGKENAKVISPIMETFVILSILSGLNGQIIGGSKAAASLSAENIIPDHRGSFIRLNGQARPQFAQYSLIGLTLIWFIFLSIIDTIYLGCESKQSVIAATNYATDLTAIINFTGYAAIMGGAIWNRFKKENVVEVEKKWYFIPTALIATIGLAAVSLFQAYHIISSLFIEKDWMPFVIFSTSIVIPIILLLHFNKKTKTFKMTKRKEEAIKRFWNLETDPIFLNGNHETFMGNKYPFLLKYPSKKEAHKYK